MLVDRIAALSSSRDPLNVRSIDQILTVAQDWRLVDLLDVPLSQIESRAHLYCSTDLCFSEIENEN